MFVFKIEVGFKKDRNDGKKGVRRLAGSCITNDPTPPPQHAETPAYADIEQQALTSGLNVIEKTEVLEDRKPITFGTGR